MAFETDIVYFAKAVNKTNEPKCCLKYIEINGKNIIYNNNTRIYNYNLLFFNLLYEIKLITYILNFIIENQ